MAHAEGGEQAPVLEPTDEDLVSACLGGERDAFSQLVIRHQDRVFNLAFRMTGNRADAADVAQESFLRAFRRLSTYRATYPFRSWILGICANVTKNRFRSESRRRALEGEHAYAVGAGADGAGSARSYSAQEEVLDRALMRLPTETRALLVLKYMEGLSGADIAQALRIGLGAVKMRLLRGRKELLGLVRELEKEMPS